ncbi:hypothetical protein FQA39_LY12154 [Lamprigera yunnana]|nr:hypothetical protein FQA39_LY12154 [Lamprigera yunnana]
MTGYTWVSSSFGRAVPSNAMQAGTDSDGCKIYVGRSRFQGDFLPCKIVPQRGKAYVAHSCKEHKVTNFEINMDFKSMRSAIDEHHRSGKFSADNCRDLILCRNVFRRRATSRTAQEAEDQRRRQLLQLEKQPERRSSEIQSG